MTVTAAQWKAAAVANFHQVLADLLGRDMHTIRITLHDHPHTAAVQWDDHNNHIMDVHLFLPVMRPGAKLTNGDQKALAGYWVHEALHVLRTDRAAWGRALQRSKAFSRVVNGLEDVRMEGAELKCNRIPGARDVLTAITERAVWTGPATPARVNKKSSLAAVLAYLGRDRLNGFNLSRADEITNALTPDNALVVARVLTALKSAQNTGDVVDIVDRLFRGGFKVDEPATPDADIPEELRDLLNEIPEDFETLDNESTQDGEADPDATGDADGEGADGEGDADGEGADGEGADGEGADGEGADGEGDADAGTGEAQDGDANGDPAKGAGGGFGDVEDGDRMDDAEGDKAVRDIANKANGAPLENSEKQVINGADDMRTSHEMDERTTTSGRTGNRTFKGLGEMLDGTGQMRIAARRLVKSLDRAGWDRNREHGRLDVRALSRAKRGARDVYKTADKVDGETAAVALVLDGSGSMQDECAHQAAMALAVARAIEDAGAPVSVWTFAFGGLLRVKGWNERIKQVAQRFVGAGAYASGGTPLCPAILKAGTELSLREADRHILIVLTDGQDNYGSTHVRHAVRLAQAQGVEVVAVAITSPGIPAEYFGFQDCDAYKASTPEALGGAVLGELVKQLEARQ